MLVFWVTSAAARDFQSDRTPGLAIPQHSPAADRHRRGRDGRPTPRREASLPPGVSSYILGFIDAAPKVKRDELAQLTVLGSPNDLPRLIQELGIERVIVAFSNESSEQTGEIIRLLKDFPTYVDIVPRLFDVIPPGLTNDAIEGVPLISLPPLRLSRSSRLLKRSLDLVVASALLVFLAPIFLMVALIIKVDSRGPIFFANPGWAVTRRFRDSSQDDADRRRGAEARAADTQHPCATGWRRTDVQGGRRPPDHVSRSSPPSLLDRRAPAVDERRSRAHEPRRAAPAHPRRGCPRRSVGADATRLCDLGSPGSGRCRVATTFRSRRWSSSTTCSDELVTLERLQAAAENAPGDIPGQRALAPAPRVTHSTPHPSRRPQWPRHVGRATGADQTRNGTDQMIMV